MQTILGANGQIATELARTLHQQYPGPLRLVSRTPRKVNEDDTLMAADLLDAGQTTEAVKGSKIVYFTAGLPHPLGREVSCHAEKCLAGMPGGGGWLCLFR